MKKAIFSMFAAALLMSAASCSDDDNGNNANITVEALTNTITNQAWRITAYSEDGIDQTSNFTGYNFTFNDDNTVLASNGTNTYNGVWTITEDDSQDDLTTNPDLNITFGSPDDFVEISEDWYTVERTGSKVRLMHDSGSEEGGTDYLTFERNAD